MAGVEHIPGSPIPAGAQTRLNILLKAIDDGMFIRYSNIANGYLFNQSLALCLKRALNVFGACFIVSFEPAKDGKTTP
jgi:hypothetical protein